MHQNLFESQVLKYIHKGPVTTLKDIRLNFVFFKFCMFSTLYTLSHESLFNKQSLHSLCVLASNYWC